MRVEADTMVLYGEIVEKDEDTGRLKLSWLINPMEFVGGPPFDAPGAHYVARLSSKPDTDESGTEKLLATFLSEMADKHPEYQITIEEFDHVVFYGQSELGKLVKLVHRNPGCSGSPYYVFVEFNMFGDDDDGRAVLHIMQTYEATAESIVNGTYKSDGSLRIGDGDSKLTVGLVGGTVPPFPEKDSQGEAIGLKVPAFYAKHIFGAGFPSVLTDFAEESVKIIEPFSSVDFSPQSEYEPAQHISQAVPPQSSYSPQPQQVSQPQTDTMSVQTVNAGKGLSVGGIIVGIFIPLVGLILGIIGMVQNKKAGGKGTIGKVAIAVSVISWLIILYARTALM